MIAVVQGYSAYLVNSASERPDPQTLLLEHGDAAYHFAYRLTGQADDAADLVQDGFLKAFEKLGRYDPARPFRPWLFQILYRLFVDRTRRNRLVSWLSLDGQPSDADGSQELALPSPEANPLDRLAAKSDEERLRRALLRLSPAARTTLTLYDIEGLSYEEVASVLQCPVGTVRSRLFDARRRLRNLLESEKEMP